MHIWLKDLLLPPTPLLLLAFAGVLVRPRLAAVAVLALALLATPWVSTRLLAGLETLPALTPEQLRAADAQAVVVLSAESADGAEYGRSSVGPLTLVRLRYAARVQRVTRLPLLTSGGTLPSDHIPVAATMRDILKDEFRVPVRWIEDRSNDTWENARFSAELLRARGVERVLLVTHAWHMPRAVAAFERAGLAVVAAPTAFTEPSDGLVPSAKALAASYYAFYERLGAVYYRLAKS